MSTPRAAVDPPPARLPFVPAPRRRRTLAATLLSSLSLLATPPHSLRAQAIVTAAAGEGEEVIATLRANDVPRGEFTLLRRADGDFWIRAADLAQIGVQPLPAARRDHAGEAWYSARALGATGVRFDEATLTLSLLFRAETLAGTHFDLSNRPPPLQRAPASDSLVLSYRLSLLKSSHGELAAAVAADLNVRVAGLLLRQEMQLDTSGRHGGPRRGATQAIHDDLQNARRLALGDVLSTAGAYGSTITGAGVLFAKVYDLAPELIHQPMANVQAATTLPADVEVTVDGSPVFRGHVAPGPIGLDNLLLGGGTRNVQVVITDAAGRREVIARPFLFTDSVLARGFHDYSYFVGRRSELDAVGVLRYREPAWQGWHRYGVSDSITVAAGGEGSNDFHNGGAGVTLRSDALGLFSLDLLASRDRRAHHEARGWSARYTYLSPWGNVVLGRREFADGFRTFTTGAASPFPRSETRIGLGTQWGRVSLSADWVRTVTVADVRDTGFLRAATALAHGLSVMGEWQTTRIDNRKGWAANLYLRADLDTQRWIAATAHAENGERRLDLEAGRQLPDGEGYGYRVGTTTELARNGRLLGTTAFGAFDWNLRPATVSLFASSEATASGSSFLQADVAGALVGIDGYFGPTRQIGDAFVLARLGVPQAGVQILLNNQPQGRTDAQGRLLIPQVSSLGRQELGLNDQDLGIQYTLHERQRAITPAFRSGAVVDFGITRVRALAGTAWQVDAGRRAPVVARTWSMRGPGGTLQIETASAGEFYLEDAPPGTYTGTLQGRTRTYACRLVVPASQEAVQELQEGLLCE